MADDGMDVRFVNESAFVGLLADLGRELRDLHTPMTDAGTAMVSSARTGAPHRTGRMAASISGSYTGPNRYTLTVAHPGAAAVHWGWPGHGIRRQPWVVARWWKDQTWLDRAGAGVQSLLDTAAGKVT